MQKKYLYPGLFFLLINFSFSAYAQSYVQISRPLGDDQVKSVSKARFITLSNTALSMGTGLAAVNLFENSTIQKTGAWLAAYGLIMAPATGNMYAQDYSRAFVGIAARAVGAYLMIDATREIFGDRFADEFNVDNKEVSLTDTKILIGEALIVGGFIYNVISAKKSVEEYNLGTGKISLNISPAVVNDRVAPVLTANLNF